MKEINAMSLFNDLRKAKVGDEFKLRDYEINEYELVYDLTDEHTDYTVRDTFIGTRHELDEHLDELEKCGFHNIVVNEMGAYEE